MYLIGNESNHALERGELDNAELACKQILDYLAILNELNVEPQIAVVYHQLGAIAYLRQQFDLAEQWYKKALEIRERLGHPPLMVNTLAQLGVLRREQERLPESVVWFGKALMIAAEYRMRVGGQILRDLARLMKVMGESEFVAVWQQAFGEEPPLDALREAMKDKE